MEIGEEISQKIRSAIKAKLVDLGAYVDDELPDYIMVMVANRKTQPQMTEDLNLFLGNHTDAFTTWLHGLLEKLQSITADPPEDQAKNVIEKVTEKGREEHEDPKEKSTEKPPSEKPDQVEPVINLNPEHDEFEEVKSADPNDNLKSKDQKTKRRRSSADEKKRSQDKHLSSSTKSTKDKEKQITRSTNNKEESRKSESSSTRASAASRLGPRRETGSGLMSSVGAVIKHDLDVSDDEYDPLNPSVGSVASIVKVTERKSTLPPDKQANKSLLFKAMKDAEKSVTTKKQTGKIVDTSTSSRKHRSHRDDDRDRESSRRRHDRERRHSSSSHMRSSRMDEERRHKEDSVRDRLGTKRASVMSRLGGEGSPTKFNADSNGRYVEIVRKVKQEPKELKRRSDSDLRSSKLLSSKVRTENEQEALKPKRRKTDKEGADTIDLTMEEDSRRIEYQGKDTISQPDDVRRIQPSVADEDVLDVLIESGADDLDDFIDVEMSANTDDLDEDSMNSQAEANVIRESIHSGDRNKRKESEPKFVVTLDGVDPRNLAADSDRVVPSGIAYPSRPEMTSTPKNVVMVRPQPPAVEPVMINLSEMEGDDDAAPNANVSAAKAEKCRFFPACKNGEQCPYVHPTTPCSNFPDCRFGDRCLYIHPDCKFDAACTRPNCPYTHSLKKSSGALPPTSMTPLVLQPIGVPLMFPRPPVPRAPSVRPSQASHPAEITCRFFPMCTNMNCPFKHPKPCRYGIGCTNKEACRFSHPSLPSASKLKWTPQLAMASKAANQAAEQTIQSTLKPRGAKNTVVLDKA